MKPIVRSLIAALFLSGCAHGSASSAAANDSRGTARHEGECSPTQVERHFEYDELGLRTRVVERRVCGVTKLRVVDTIDRHESIHTREVMRDRDLDGSFEQRHVRVRPLTESFANRLRDQTVPEIAASGPPVDNDSRGPETDAPPS
jgi:hypothetical protein